MLLSSEMEFKEKVLSLLILMGMQANIPRSVVKMPRQLKEIADANPSSPVWPWAGREDEKNPVKVA